MHTELVLKMIWNVFLQAGVWQDLIESGIEDVTQPAAFRLALVLRHSPPDLAARILHDLLEPHPQGVRGALHAFVCLSI